MSGTLGHVANLTDVELYEELKKCGFSAGPVVASTRKLYERKLSQILEGRRGHSDEPEPIHQAGEIEEQLTQPVNPVGGFGHTGWSPDSVRARISQSQAHSTYSGDVAAGRSSVFQSTVYYTPSREQERDEMRAHSSVSSPYVGTVRGVGDYEDNSRASPAWLAHSSPTQPYTSPSWRTYGSSGDESLGKARYRTTLSGTSPSARQETASRYRLPGFADEKASVWNRPIPERQRNKSLGPKGQFGVFVFLVLVSIAFCYMVYNAWNENDPYQQIEQEVVKIVEEGMDK